MNAKWLGDAIIYQIMVDRFSTAIPKKDSLFAKKTSKDWIGGNLKGIIKHFDHLEKLGINAIYLSPIYSTSNYDGYSIVDFFKIDPHFGSENDLKNLVELCHKNDMKVILDFVPNHMSVKNPIFVDACKNEKSRYHDWFIFKKWPNQYLSFLDVKELPKINVDNEEAREYIISTARYWMQKFSIDGYRLDHVIGPSIDFLKEFKKEMKSISRDFVLIGEAGKALGSHLKEIFEKEWIETIWIAKSFSDNKIKKLESTMKKDDLSSCIKFNDMMMKGLEGVVDGCMDFSFRDLTWAFASGRISLREFWSRLDEHYKKFKKNYHLIALLSNHDCGRFLSFFGKNKTKTISSLQFSLSKPKLIHYGEEIGLKDGKGPFEESRRFMVWNKEAWDKELLEHYKNLCKKNL